MDELKSRAFSYKKYQKTFKIDVTKYEELEQVHAELRLKELLWCSMEEWDVLLKDWYDQKFDTIEPDEMGNVVQKYAKDVHRLEKGLPPNNVRSCFERKSRKTKGPHVSDYQSEK